jgi:hypothetical protein
MKNPVYPFVAGAALLVYASVTLTQTRALFGFAAWSTLAFWSILLMYLITHPLRRAVGFVSRAFVRKSRLALVFPIYLTTHLFAYGFFIESIFALRWGFISSASYLFFGYNYSFSPQAWRVAYSFFLNPSISVVLPLGYGANLTAYSFFIGTLDAALVTANLMQFVSSVGLLRRSGVLVGLPLVSVVSGAGCCISLPTLLGIISPSVQVLLLTRAGILVENALYVLLPASVAFFLWLTFEHMNPIRVKHIMASYTRKKNNSET